MRLELRKVQIEGIDFADKTHVKGGRLYIDGDELTAYLMEDDRIRDVKIEFTRPGDSVRIVPIKDIVEPRAKTDLKEDWTYPGWGGVIRPVGKGETWVLDNCAVIVTGKKIRFGEGLIDMSGPGSQYTSFSKLHNVVIQITCSGDIDDGACENSIRVANFKAATYLAKTAAKAEYYEKEILQCDSIVDAVSKYKDLPKVVYVNMLAGYSTVYGVDVRGMIPTLISPLEAIDGAIGGSVLPGPCHRNTSYHHSKNPVIYELMRRHGHDLCFLGVILTNVMHSYAGKERSSFFVKHLAETIGAEGAVITQDGAGNPDTDSMLIIKKLENSGIKTVLIKDEMCGRDGFSPGLADTCDEADAVISTGNVNELVELPSMERVIGSLDVIEELAGGYRGSVHEDGSISIETTMIMGAHSQLGLERVKTILR